MSRIRSRLFNQDQIAWLRENYNTMLIADLVTKLNDKYKTNFTDKQVYRFCWAHWGNSVFSGKPNKDWFLLEQRIFNADAVSVSLRLAAWEAWKAARGVTE